MTQRDNPLIAKKYNSKKWRKVRQAYLISVNGLCERCKKENTYNSAVIVHHKNYINENNYMLDEVFFSFDNLEALCRNCHNKEHFKEQVQYKFNENGDLIYYDK